MYSSASTPVYGGAGATAATRQAGERRSRPRRFPRNLRKRQRRLGGNIRDVGAAARTLHSSWFAWSCGANDRHASISSATSKFQRECVQRAGERSRRRLAAILAIESWVTPRKPQHDAVALQPHRFGQISDIHIRSEQHHVGEAAVEHLAQLLQLSDLDLEPDQMADNGAGAFQHGADAAGPPRYGCP